MTFGIIIDNDYLRTLPEFKGKPDSAISAADRGRVAMTQKNVYESEAIKRLDELKGNYGNGVSTLVRIYNASGDRITLKDDYSWRGSFYSQSAENPIENGQWGVFLHVKPGGAAVGSCGAVIYRTVGNADIFIGWQNPWNTSYDPTCYGEARQRDNWWDRGSKSYMLYLLDDKSGNKFNDSGAGSGYKVSGNIGGSTTSHYQAVVEKN